VSEKPSLLEFLPRTPGQKTAGLIAAVATTGSAQIFDLTGGKKCKPESPQEPKAQARSTATGIIKVKATGQTNERTLK